jgi:hypothetical protein
LLLGIQVGSNIRVCIARLDEETNDLIISEKKAWVSTMICHLKLQLWISKKSDYMFLYVMTKYHKHLLKFGAIKYGDTLNSVHGEYAVYYLGLIC